MKSTVVRAALATLGVTFTTIVNAQPSMVIPDAVSCAGCSISTRSVVTLGSTDGPGALSGRVFVMADNRGRYWVFSHREVPRIFGADGRFLQTIGATGEGPGEFVNAQGSFPVSGDSVVVLDGSGRRATVIGPDLHIGRMIRLAASLHPDAVVVRWPDTVIAGGTIPTRAAMNTPLHTVSFAGPLAEMLRDFGQDDAGPPGINPGALRRPLSPAKSGGAWAGELGRYRLTLWTAAGTRVRTIERNPSWFVPSTDLFGGTPTQPPPATISAIREDPATGLLWVFVAVAARTWREAWPARVTGGEVAARGLASEKLTDTRIEVLDPSAGRLVAVGLIPGPASMLRDGRAVVYTVDGDGIPRMNIMELRLNGWRDR